MHIVLHQPEIPANTGNIGRTCVATGTSLHLIEPLGFRLNEKEVRRAGMDYWEKLNVNRYMNYEEFFKEYEKHEGSVLWMATTKAGQVYTDVEFGPDDFIMFGKESAGIPEEILVEHEKNCIRIPMLSEIRSLNLSNAVSIVLYEALRQNNFDSLQRKGKLHRLEWNVKASDKPFIADGAVVLGNVTVGEDVGIWYNATVRGDRGPVVIGRGSNIQDNAVVHVDSGFSVTIGENVTVGHGAIIHGCSIGDNTLVGMGAIIMNGADIGRNCIVAAGALVTQGVKIPDNSLVIGNPAKVKREVTDEEIEGNLRNAELYAEEARSLESVI